MDLALWISVARAAAIVVALLAFAWGLRRMRHESAGKLDALLVAQQLARAETSALTGFDAVRRGSTGFWIVRAT